MTNENNPFFEDAKKEQWRGDYNMAIQYYQRAIQLQPDRGEIYWEMSISLAHLGRSEEANAAQQKAAKLDPHIREMVERGQSKPGKLDEIKKLSTEGPGSCKALLAYVNDKDFDVKQAAKKALQDQNYKVDATCVDPLIEAMRTTEDMFVNYYFEPLARIGQPAVEPLMGLLKHKNKDTVAGAISSLSKIGDKRVVPVLLEYMKDKRYSVAEAAIRGLRLMKPPEALKPVMELIRKAADPWAEPNSPAELLGELGDRRAYDLLVELLSNKSIPTAGAAISALGKLGDTRAIPLLRPFLKSEKSHLCSQAVTALSRLHDGESEAAIKELGNQDPDRYVREAASEALPKLKEKHTA